MADRYTVLDADQILDGTITENEINSSVRATNSGLSGGSGSKFALDLNDLASIAVDVSADSIALLDATDSSTKLESIADLATAMAGSGLTATNGVFSVDSIANNIVESDFVKDDEISGLTGLINGSNTDFDLSAVPLTASLDVYLNGQYQTQGASADYQLNPDTGDTQTIRFAIAPASGAKITARYVINN